ncbi:MAG: dihydropteroate synthase [Clostridiales bacterium]|nr:dihydropteroate synthase [Clostridiales bacterium]
MKIGKQDFVMGERTYIMGILNVTPDSFSDGGKHNRLDDALKHAELMIKEGADIIDIGGESTRPNYTMVSEEEEIERVVPIIEAVRNNWDIPISIDTYKSKVARAACQAGADLVNDIWGLKYDPDMANLVEETGVAVCLMHNRPSINYESFHDDFIADMTESIQIAKDAGIADDRIMIDPGIGFAKTHEMNLNLVKNLEMMHQFSYPVLLGTSRKSMIGNVLNVPVDQRLEGTLATTVIAVMKGCQFLRVHDIKENKKAIQMTEAILQSKEIHGKKA